MIYYREMDCGSIFRVSGWWLSTIVHMQTHKGIAFSLRMHGVQPSVRPERCHYRHDYAYSDKQSTPLRCRARVAQPETWIYSRAANRIPYIVLLLRTHRREYWRREKCRQNAHNNLTRESSKLIFFHETRIIDVLLKVVSVRLYY